MPSLIICFGSALLLSARVDGTFLRSRSPNYSQEKQRRICRISSQCVDYSGWNGSRHLTADSSSIGPKINLDQNYAGGYRQSSSKAAANLCINGHVAPRFFLLGAQKSTTTNFATRLIWVGLSIFPPTPQEEDPPHFWKELHMFDNKTRCEEIGVDGWLDYYPECSDSTYAVGMDATPSYISSREAPSLMAAWYGPDRWKQLEFLVIIRAPFQRMRSSYYTAKTAGGACSLSKNFCGSFGTYLRIALENYRNGCPSGRAFANIKEWQECEAPDEIGYGLKGDPFYLSMYMPQFENWLSHFEAKQFVIAPVLTYVAPKPGVPSLVEFIANRLGTAIKADSDTGAIPKSDDASGTKTKYPPFREVMGPLSSANLREVMQIVRKESGASKLAHLLAPRMQEGLTLFGYTGPHTNETTIGQWIKDNWCLSQGGDYDEARDEGC